MPPRDPSAFLCDILEAAAAIQAVSDRVVWGAIQVDLPELVEHCTQLLDRLSPRS